MFRRFFRVIGSCALRNKKIISDLLITGKPAIRVKEYFLSPLFFGIIRITYTRAKITYILRYFTVFEFKIIGVLK